MTNEVSNLDELRKLKELRNKYIKERQSIELTIQTLQSEMEVIDYYLGHIIEEKDTDWHSKPPLPSAEIQSIYNDTMTKYNKQDKEPEND